MKDLKQEIVNYPVAENVTNRASQTDEQLQKGIEYGSALISPNVNDFWYRVYKAAQFVQYTGGMYSDKGYYDEGNLCTVLAKNGDVYDLITFIRTGANADQRQGSPPIKDAAIENLNGIAVYKGGTTNAPNWDIMYNLSSAEIEAIEDTVMKRDSEGASNVNMPTGIKDTSIVNNKYLQQTKTELQNNINTEKTLREEAIKNLQNTKQNNLTAGDNISINTDIIKVIGGVSKKYETAANYLVNDLVSYDGKLYIVNTAFTSTNWQTDEVNMTLAGGKIDQNNVINIWNKDSEYKAGQYAALEGEIQVDDNYKNNALITYTSNNIYQYEEA